VIIIKVKRTMTWQQNTVTALSMYDEMQNKFGASLALYNLGQLHCDLKKYDEAIAFATKSLDYAKAIGVLDQTYHSEKLLSELYGFKNNFKLSFFQNKNSFNENIHHSIDIYRHVQLLQKPIIGAY